MPPLRRSAPLLFCLLLLGQLPLAAQPPVPILEVSISRPDYQIRLPYEWINNKIIITAETGGRKRRFIFDTGATNVISEALRRELQLSAGVRLPMEDASGKRDTLQFVRLPSLTLDGVDFRNATSAVLADTTIFSCLDVDGIIGSNMFSRSVIRIDSRKQELLIAASAKAFGLRSRDAIRLETDFQNRPYIPVQLGGKAGHEVLFDSGDGSLYTISQQHYDKLRSHGVFQELATATGSSSYSLHGTARAVEAKLLAIPELQIGSGSLQNVRAIAGAEGSSRIGARLTAFGIVTIDFRQKKWYFEPFAGRTDAGEKSWTISPSFADGKLVAGQVWDAGLRQQVQPGDQIVSVNGRNTEALDFCSLLTGDNPLTLPGPETATLTLRKTDGTVQQVTIRKL